MSTPYCRGDRVISLQMGSAVSQLLLPKATDLQHVCQRAHRIIHIMRLLLHLLSRCSGVGWEWRGWGWGSFGHLGPCRTCTTTYTFNLPVSTVICFAHIEIHLCLQSSYLAPFQSGWISFFKLGHGSISKQRVTQEWIFYSRKTFPVQSQSCDRKKWVLSMSLCFFFIF